MKVTDSAQDAILKVMRSKQMEPKSWFFELRLLTNGAIGIGFAREIQNTDSISTFGELSFLVDQNLDTTGMLIDFKEIDGKKGLVFGEDRSS
jgi:hypothetical protein